MFQTRRRRLSPRRLLAAVAAVLLVGAPFASVAHLIAVPHEACAEHGELVHGGHDAARLPGANAKDAEGDTGGGEGSHEHDHCMLAAAASERAIWDAAPAVFVVASGATPAFVRVDRAFHPAAPDLYRLAPKNSPPA